MGGLWCKPDTPWLNLNCVNSQGVISNCCRGQKIDVEYSTANVEKDTELVTLYNWTYSRKDLDNDAKKYWVKSDAWYLSKRKCLSDMVKRAKEDNVSRLDARLYYQRAIILEPSTSDN